MLVTLVSVQTSSGSIDLAQNKSKHNTAGGQPWQFDVFYQPEQKKLSSLFINLFFFEKPAFFFFRIAFGKSSQAYPFQKSTFGYMRINQQKTVLHTWLEESVDWPNEIEHRLNWTSGVAF